MASDAPLDESNEGFKMLKAMGWTEGSGLGRGAKGRVAPLSATLPEAEGRSGLGKSTEEATMLAGAAKERRKLDVEHADTDARKRKREAERDRLVTLDATREAMHRDFYCACCDKQYRTVAEFSGHLSSYDHGHRKRFAEMRQSEKARTGDDAESKRRKEERRAARDLQRRIDAANASAPAVAAVSAPAPAPAPARAAADPAAAAPRRKFGFAMGGAKKAPIKFAFGKPPPA